MPLTVYTSEGLPKLPLGPQGPPGPQGPAGPQGPYGQPLRWWQRPGDNSGDASWTNTVSWGTAKSPEFTVPATRWYRVWATFDLTTNTNGTNVTGAILIDGSPMRALAATIDSGAYVPFAMHPGAELTAGQKITIGYRPLIAGRTATLVNSSGVIPILIIEEVTPPTP